jgi:hypothetical protein
MLQSNLKKINKIEIEREKERESKMRKMKAGKEGVTE